MKNADLFLVAWADDKDLITAETITRALDELCTFYDATQNAWIERDIKVTHISADIAASAHLVGIQQRGVTATLLEEIRDELKSMRQALEKKP
jgi:class 3 adenylate cyclase